MKYLKLGKDFVVTLHNDLIQARFKTTYTLNEQKILYAVLSNIEPPEFKKDEHGKRYISKRIESVEPFRVPIKEFTEWLGIADPNYAAFNKTMDRLMEKDLIEIVQPDGSWKKFRWVLESSYIAKTGIAEIILSPSIYPYILNLENNFTTIKLDTLLSFKSRYSIRLYQLIKKWSKLGKWKIEVDELKMMLGVPYEEKNGMKIFKLDLYGNFKNKALNKALEEINKLTEFNVELEEIKKGRKVVALNFTILEEGKKVDKVPSKSEEQPDSPGVSEEYGNSLIKKYDYRDQKVFDKTSGKQIYLDDSERVQLILLNRKNYHNLNIDDKTYRLLEKELVKVVNNPRFNISNETEFIFSYVYRSTSIDNPAAFILSQTRKLVERLLQGENVTYTDIFKVRDHGRREVLPDFYFDGERSGKENAKNEKANKATDDTNMTIAEIEIIRIMLKLGRTKEELNASNYDMEEYYRLDREYGIENIIGKNKKDQEISA